MGTHIAKYKLKDRSTQYRYIVKSAGHKPVTEAGFLTKADAKRKGDEQYRHLKLTGVVRFRDEYKKHTVGKLMERYLKEIAPGKGSFVTIDATINKFLDYDIAEMSIAFVKPKDVYEYIAER